MSVTLDEEQSAWVADLAQKLERSQSDVIRGAVDLARGEDSRRAKEVLMETGDTNIHQNEPGGTERLERVEEDVGEILGRLDRLSDRLDAEGAERRAERVAPETTHTLSDADETGGGDDDEAGTDPDAAAAAVRDHFGDGGPQKAHVREAVVAVVRHLALSGATETAELKEIVMDVAGDHYAGKRNAWNSVDRYVEQVPGVHKPDYGVWGYDPEESNDSGVYDPAAEF